MHAAHPQFDIGAIQTSWQAFDAVAHLRPIHDEAEYERMVGLMNSLLEACGDDEDHPLAGKRKISATLAGKLARFFGVSTALFVSG